MSYCMNIFLDVVYSLYYAVTLVCNYIFRCFIIIHLSFFEMFLCKRPCTAPRVLDIVDCPAYNHDHDIASYPKFYDWLQSSLRSTQESLYPPHSFDTEDVPVVTARDEFDSFTTKKRTETRTDNVLDAKLGATTADDIAGAKPANVQPKASTSKVDTETPVASSSKTTEKKERKKAQKAQRVDSQKNKEQRLRNGHQRLTHFFPLPFLPIFVMFPFSYLLVHPSYCNNSHHIYFYVRVFYYSFWITTKHGTKKSRGPGAKRR